MARSYMVLDIETVPDPAMWLAPVPAPGTESSPAAPVNEKAAFPPLHAHRPIVLGAMWLDEDVSFPSAGRDWRGKRRKRDAGGFLRFVGRQQPDLVTYNGRAFDLPVLALRGLRHGVPMPWYYQGKLRNRYSEDGHLDLCDMLCDHGAARSMSLDCMARLIGLPGKVGVDGSQVDGMYKAGRLDLIKNYCLADVAQTGLLFLRFRLLQGHIEPGRYRHLAAELMDALRADPRLEPVVTAIDGERLLLAAA